MRGAGVQALIMANQNRPLEALKMGHLGKEQDVLNLARTMAREDIKQQGTRLDELERIAEEQKHYHELCGPKASQTPAAVTRRDNLAAAVAAAADAEANLIFAEEQVRAMSVKELQAIKRGWIAVGKVNFRNGAQWQAVFAKEGSGNPNAQGKRGLLREDYIADILAAIKSYEELMHGSEQPDTCDPIAAPDAEPAADPIVALVAAPAPDPALTPLPAPAPAPALAPPPPPAPPPAPPPDRDPNKRTSKRPQQYDPLLDGASDQMRLGVAKPKKLKTRRR